MDTISLEELLQQFESQPLYPGILISSNPINLQNLKIAVNFTGLSTRQLRKWYQLAKIQLQERKKIQNYAMKLMEEQLESQQQFYSKNINSYSNPFLKVKNSQQIHQFGFSQSKLDNTLQKQKEIGIQLPPIKDRRSISKSKLPKIQELPITKASEVQLKRNVFDDDCSLKRQESKNRKSRANLITKILSHEKQQTISKHSNQSNLRESQKTIETVKTPGIGSKSSKGLSKKEFLQMMKIKLNQGVDYKSGAFAKQPSKSSVEQNFSHIKKKEGQKVCIKKITNTMQNERAKTQSMHMDSKQKREGINSSTIRKSNNTSTVSVNMSEKKKQENNRYRVNSTYTSRQTVKQKVSEKKLSPIELNKMTRSQSTLINLNTNPNLQTQFQAIDIQNTFQIKPDELKIENFSLNLQKETEAKLLEQIQAQSIEKNPMIKPEFSIKNESFSIPRGSTEYKKQFFIENEDAYDDEPQLLQKQIHLRNQELQQQNSPRSTIQSLTQHTQIQENSSFSEKPIPIQSNTYDQPTIEYSSSFLVQENSDDTLSVQKHQNQKYPNQLIEAQKLIEQKKSEQPDEKNVKISSSTKKSSLEQEKIISIQKIRPLSAKITPKYPPYHLQFPSFSYLFNIKSENSASANKSKISLPYLLKSLESSLEMYFQKNVSKIAREHMTNRMALMNSQEYSNLSQSGQDELHQVNQEFKCITHIQFINTIEGASLFDLDLTSFKQRSFTLLKKIKSDYLPYQNQSNQSKNHLKQKQTDALFYRVVKNKPEVYDIINTSFYRTQNWLQLPHGMDLQGCWNLLWTWSKPQIDFNTLIKFQKVNHFPGSKQLARKDLLKKNIEKIKKMSKKLNEYFDIIPETFFLPGQNIPFIKKFRESQFEGRNLWILKPVGLSRGRGISLISKLQEVVFSEPIVMQKYIHNPLLLEGFKFDLRIYVLVTSINPLECFIYKQGFARVSTERYCNDLEEIGNKFVHLTNYSIQKDSVKCPQMFTQQQKELGGCKLTLKMLRKRLQKNNINWDHIWTQIQQVVLKSLISCMKYIPQNANCFELFGYDIMIDENLKCWLIQVNSSPSLEKDFLLDEIVKQQLVDDIIEVVEPVEFDRSELLKVIKRRRKEFEGLKSHVNYSNNSAEQLNQDLFHILKGKTLRNYGEVKEHKNFKCLAPGGIYEKILKTVQHFTHDQFVKNINFY